MHSILYCYIELLKLTDDRHECHHFDFNIPEDCHHFADRFNLGVMLTNEKKKKSTP